MILHDRKWLFVIPPCALASLFSPRFSLSLDRRRLSGPANGSFRCPLGRRWRTYPNGILPWRGGVFVTCAPDIFYLKDTDGDGVADEQQVVLTGFGSGKTSQLRVASPTLGFDGSCSPRSMPHRFPGEPTETRRSLP
ncbi:MAG: DUF7133 domain-containing protein [Opitutaceae bacterium]